MSDYKKLIEEVRNGVSESAMYHERLAARRAVSSLEALLGEVGGLSEKWRANEWNDPDDELMRAHAAALRAALQGGEG